MLTTEYAELLLYTYGAVGVAGFLLLVLAVCYWRSVGGYVADSWGKVAVEVVQLLVTVGSIATTFAAAADKAVWFRPAVTGAVCLGVWKILQIVLDIQVKAVEAGRKAEAAEYQKQAATYARLLAVLHQAVKGKVGRLYKVIRKRKGLGRIEQVRAALTPHPHLDDLLDAVAEFFCGLLPEPERQVRAFRVGVYVARDRVMKPVHGVSNRNPGANPFTSFELHREYFHLDAARPAHAVQVVRQQGMIVVPDCAAAASEGSFYFFNTNQPSYLRSMVSYYLGKVCLEDATMSPAALVIDTDAPGFFKESEQESLRYHLHEFGIRIKLELLLQTLIEKRGATHERPVSPDGASGEAGGGGEEAAGGIPEGDGAEREGT